MSILWNLRGRVPALGDMCIPPRSCRHSYSQRHSLFAYSWRFRAQLRPGHRNRPLVVQAMLVVWVSFDLALAADVVSLQVERTLLMLRA